MELDWAHNSTRRGFGNFDLGLFTLFPFPISWGRNCAFGQKRHKSLARGNNVNSPILIFDGFGRAEAVLWELVSVTAGWVLTAFIVQRISSELVRYRPKKNFLPLPAFTALTDLTIANLGFRREWFRVHCRK